MKSLALTLTTASLLLLACDPAGAVVVDNQSESGYVVVTNRLDAGIEFSDRLQVPATRRVMVGANGVGGPHLDTASLLGQDCAPLMSFDVGNGEGGVITIRPDGSATFAPGGNPATAPIAESATDCPPPPTPEAVPGLD